MGLPLGAESRRDPFDGNPMYVRTMTRVLKRDCAHVTIRIDVKDRVFVEIPGLGDITIPKLNV